MTYLTLLPYECKRCHKTFMSYFEIIDSNDKQFIKDIMEDRIAVDYIHPIKNERECRACRKGLDLVNYV